MDFQKIPRKSILGMFLSFMKSYIQHIMCNPQKFNKHHNKTHHTTRLHHKFMDFKDTKKIYFRNVLKISRNPYNGCFLEKKRKDSLDKASRQASNGHQTSDFTTREPRDRNLKKPWGGSPKSAHQGGARVSRCFFFLQLMKLMLFKL
jgi:hypothetical protein